MAITSRTAEISEIGYANYTYEFVDRFNFSSVLVNSLIKNQAVGVIGSPGVIKFIADDTTITTLTSNYNVGLVGGSTKTSLELENWTFYFNKNNSILTILSTPTKFEYVFTDDSGYIYVDFNGNIISVSTPYSSYQNDRVRLLRYFKNSVNEYSIIVMPEFATTPKYVRSMSLVQALNKPIDITIVAKSGTQNFIRTGTKVLTEGAGSLSVLDENILLMADDTSAAVTKLLNENSNVEYTTFNTTADAWLTGTAYTLGDFVKESGVTYRCLSSHTSGTFADDLAAGYWIKVSHRTAQLFLTYDGKFIVKYSRNYYESLAEAVVELPYEYYDLVGGDSAKEYAPVARIAFEVDVADLADTSKVYILNLTNTYQVQRTPVWYNI